MHAHRWSNKYSNPNSVQYANDWYLNDILIYKEKEKGKMLTAIDEKAFQQFTQNGY